MKYFHLGFACALVLVLLASCTLVPKQIEYFQDRIEAVPERSAEAEEGLRQAAQLAANKAVETERAAIAAAAPLDVLSPARDTVALTDTVSDQIGPPLRPWKGEVERLLEHIDRLEARYQRDMNRYSEEVQELEGKVIEGTGMIRMGYFTHLFLILVLLLVGWIALRIVAATNAPLHAGLGVIHGGNKALGRAVLEIVEAGQDFKTAIEERFAHQPELAKAIIDEFNTTQRQSQSRDVQAAVKAIKPKRFRPLAKHRNAA